MNPASITRADLLLAAPEAWLLAAACVVLVVDLLIDDRRRWVTLVLSLVALAGTAWLAANGGVTERTVAWAGTYVADPVGAPGRPGRWRSAPRPEP
jgi:NADH-quinone oxidoreductase subunit N